MGHCEDPAEWEEDPAGVISGVCSPKELGVLTRELRRVSFAEYGEDWA